jgi:hypothetical protein
VSLYILRNCDSIVFEPCNEAIDSIKTSNVPQIQCTQCRSIGTVFRKYLLAYVTQVRSDFAYVWNTVRLRIVRA